MQGSSPSGEDWGSVVRDRALPAQSWHCDGAEGEVSRIEYQGDLLLSTLARYIDAMDGSLSLLVRFADSETIELRLMLDGLTEQNPDPSLVPDPRTAIHLAG